MGEPKTLTVGKLCQLGPPTRIGGNQKTPTVGKFCQLGPIFASNFWNARPAYLRKRINEKTFRTIEQVEIASMYRKCGGARKCQARGERTN